MKIAVFGATGPTGQHLVAQAIEQGHEVTAFARRPDALPPRERVRVVQGDTMRDADKVAEAVRGQDAVVSALGVGKAFTANGLIEYSVRNIATAMARERVRRFVLMSAFGVGETQKDAPFLPRIAYRTLLADVFADKKAAEDDLRTTGLDWTIVYPVILTNGPLTRRYRYAERLFVFPIPTISRADAAHFMLGELTEPQYIRKSVVVSY